MAREDRVNMKTFFSWINWMIGRGSVHELLYRIHRKRLLHLRELLILIDRLMKSHRIAYWIDYGTLLGAYRNGRFIPWDRDIDVSIMAADHDRVLGLNAYLPPRYRIDISENLQTLYEDGTEFLRLRDRESSRYIDIYHYRETGGNLLQELSLSFDGKGYYENRPVDAGLIFPLGSILLEGGRFPCPNRVEAFLLTRYRRLEPRVISYQAVYDKIRAPLKTQSPE